MPDYQAMYQQLFQAVTAAADILAEAQAATEDVYIDTSPYDADLDKPQNDDN